MVPLREVVSLQAEGSLEDLRDGVIRVLNCEERDEETGTPIPSLLSQLLNGQRIDILGVVRAHKLFYSLTPQQQTEVYGS